MDSAVLITGPAIEPLDTSECNTHLKISGEDQYVNSLLMTARQMLERELGRSFILQTWTAYDDEWSREMYLDYPPLLSVTSVKYYDIDGVLQTLDPASYWVNNKEEPGCVKLAYDFTAPELQYGRPNSIEILYTAGYAATGDAPTKMAAVPEPIKHSIKILMTDMHEHRGQYVIGSTAMKIPRFILDLVHSYKIYNFCE